MLIGMHGHAQLCVCVSLGVCAQGDGMGSLAAHKAHFGDYIYIEFLAKITQSPSARALVHCMFTSSIDSRHFRRGAHSATRQVRRRGPSGRHTTSSPSHQQHHFRTCCTILARVRILRLVTETYVLLYTATDIIFFGSHSWWCTTQYKELPTVVISYAIHLGDAHRELFREIVHSCFDIGRLLRWLGIPIKFNWKCNWYLYWI